MTDIQILFFYSLKNDFKCSNFLSILQKFFFAIRQNADQLIID